MKNIISFIAIFLLSGNVSAAGKSSSSLKGEMELGLVSTRGNTETQNINGKATVISDMINWKHTGKLEVLNSSDNGTTTAERYFISAKSAHKIDESNYEFGLLTYEADRFSGFDYRASASLGYGHTLFRTNVKSLDLEAGAGIRQSKETATGDTQDEGFLRGAGIFEWNVSDNATFGEEFTVEAGEDSTITKSITSLKSKVTGNLATKITYTLKKTTNVPPGVKETDMELAANLVYSF